MRNISTHSRITIFITSYMKKLIVCPMFVLKFNPILVKMFPISSFNHFIPSIWSEMNLNTSIFYHAHF